MDPKARVLLSPGQRVSVYFTNYCNQKCPGCFGGMVRQTEAKKNLRPSDVRAFRQILNEDTHVIITGGGEPTMNRRHFFGNLAEMCRGSASGHKPAFVTIKTNGRAFSSAASTRAFLRRLKKAMAGVGFEVLMSIDDHHTSSQTWEQLAQKARNLRAASLDEGVQHGFLTTTGKADPEHVNSAEKIARFCGLPIKPSGAYVGFIHDKWESHEDFHNRAGEQLSVTLGPDGSVYSNFRELISLKPCGNVRRTPPGEMLASRHKNLVYPEGIASIQGSFSFPHLVPHKAGARNVRRKS